MHRRRNEQLVEAKTSYFTKKVEESKDNPKALFRLTRNMIAWLNEHLIKNSMFDPLQSAYRDKHSTETALIKVQNDILSALDAGSSAILLMLDLSAAFDTIDHDIPTALPIV